MNFDELQFRFGNKLSDFDTSYTGHYKNKKEASKHLRQGTKKMRDLQEKLYAFDKYAVLIIFQAMDAAGKDSTIKHVMTGVNPQGCKVTSFKAPSEQELDHDFMWRCARELPQRGKIGIFNRSYYEEVLVARVHSDILLKKQKLPKLINSEQIPPEIWQQRYGDINNFEQYLENNGIVVLKFFLNISKEKQKQRFIRRIKKPNKNWKISLSDFKERQYWNDYMHAYESMLMNTSTEAAPWYVIPADHKWYMRAVVADIIVDKLESLDLHFPKVGEEQRKEIEKVKDLLEKEE